MVSETTETRQAQSIYKLQMDNNKMTDELKGAVLIKKRGRIRWWLHNLFAGLRSRNSSRLYEAGLPQGLVVRICGKPYWYARYEAVYGDWRIKGQ